MIKATNSTIRKEIGKRFKKFREALGLTQAEMAKKLSVYQSTITNIEVGKTFPGVKYLHYFHNEFRLNNNWLINECGELFFSEEEVRIPSPSKLNCHIKKSDPRYAMYMELIELMQIPLVEHVILARLAELKVIAKEEIKEHLMKSAAG